MRALVVRELREGFAGCAVEDLPDPRPGPGELVVGVRAASVNFPDLLMTRGAYQLKPQLPFTPGLDLAGEVEAVGAGVDPARIGEAVVAGVRTGAFAQRCVVGASAARRKPERLGWAQAAAYGAAYLTAWVALVRRAAIRPGERLLVIGAAGGVGLAAVDLGRELGARVIAGSASEAKLRAVSRAYAPEAVVELAPGFRERVKALTGGEGVDVVYDPVGGEVFEEAMRCLAPEARVLVVGFASGRPGVPRSDLLLIKQASLLGVRAGEHGRRHPAMGAEDLAAVDRLAAEGRIRPYVHAELPLDAWREAFELLARREVVGKAVLRP